MTKNANVLITGATSGIGEALALYYAQTGAANLFICGRDKLRLADVKQRCESFGAKVYAELMDVTDSEPMRKWLEKSNSIAPLHLVIANAGVSTGEETESNVRNTVQINVCGVVNTVLPAIELFKQRDDTDKHIVLTASIAGYHGLPTAPSYSASKAFVGRSIALGFTRKQYKSFRDLPRFCPLAYYR